jgi:hypothetical protein
MEIVSQKRNIYSKSDITKFVQEWKDSGMTRIAFSLTAGVHVKTLSRWIRNDSSHTDLLRKIKNVPRPSLIPVALTNSSHSIDTPFAPTQSIEIFLPSRIRLRLNINNNLAMLISLIKELELCK